MSNLLRLQFPAGWQGRLPAEMKDPAEAGELSSSLSVQGCGQRGLAEHSPDESASPDCVSESAQTFNRQDHRSAAGTGWGCRPRTAGAGRGGLTHSWEAGAGQGRQRPGRGGPRWRPSQARSFGSQGGGGAGSPGAAHGST